MLKKVKKLFYYPDRLYICVIVIIGLTKLVLYDIIMRSVKMKEKECLQAFLFFCNKLSNRHGEERSHP